MCKKLNEWESLLNEPMTSENHGKDFDGLLRKVKSELEVTRENLNAFLL